MNDNDRASELLTKKQEELMQNSDETISPADLMEQMKTEDPRGWSKGAGSILNAMIAEYNRVVRLHNASNEDKIDVIVAFTMTEEEEEEFLNENKVQDDS